MRNGPYRRSVWVDVFGVFLFGAFLLGGAGYVLYHAGGTAASSVASTPTAESYHQGRSAAAARGHQTRPGTEGMFSSRLSSEPSPLLGDRSAPTGAATPFSEDWQKRATPSLNGPSPGGGAPPSGGGPHGEANLNGGTSPGPAIASSRSSESLGKSPGGRSVQAETADRNGGEAWRGEARELAGRARALSGQLRQLEQETSGGKRKKTSSGNKAPGEASTASATTNDRDVPNPPSVPIDDHLHWLVVAGLLWGAWRIWRGG